MSSPTTRSSTFKPTFVLPADEEEEDKKQISNNGAAATDSFWNTTTIVSVCLLLLLIAAGIAAYYFLFAGTATTSSSSSSYTGTSAIGSSIPQQVLMEQYAVRQIPAYLSSIELQDPLEIV